MKIKKKKIIDFLLKNANPSIKRRVNSGVLHNLTVDEAAIYQEQIMKEPMLQRIIACQQENGWIGKSLHGGLDTQEGAVKYLAEKLLIGRHPYSNERWTLLLPYLWMICVMIHEEKLLMSSR